MRVRVRVGVRVRSRVRVPTPLEDRAGKIESKTSANMSRVFGVGKQATDRTQFKQIEFRNQAGTSGEGRKRQSQVNGERRK